MPETNSIPQLNQEDCEKLIVENLSNPTDRARGYGYDFYLSNFMRNWLVKNAANFNIDRNLPERYISALSPRFYAAAWELCRRGILRPGVREHGAQSTDDGNSGNGYCVTPFGEQWLSETDKQNFIPTEPGRFSQMIAPYGRIFGPGFQQRANEAIRCYGAHAYLACCVMCGAAGESILLHLAIKKVNNEQEILKKYKAASGRKALENLIIGQQGNAIRQDFEVCFSLLKYWRDESAHGRQSKVDESEAYTSVALLLRCAQFSKDTYQTLTGQNTAT